MAFTGAATVTQLADDIVLITGLSLAAGPTSGTISLSAGTGDVKTAASFKIQDRKYPGNATALTRQQLLRVWADKQATAPAAASAVVCINSGADTDAGWLCTVTNIDAGNASGALNIYVQILK